MPGRSRGEWLRQRLGTGALSAAARLHRRPYVALDYSYESSPRPRWGHGRPPHHRLRELLDAHRDAFRRSLETVAAYREPLARIDLDRRATGEPYWRSAWLWGLDAAALYAFLRERAPARYVEVGAGVSTLFADRARRDGGLPTRIVSIDPEPREDVAGRCDELVRAPLQDGDLAAFADLRAGDVVLFDGSHRAVMNSDVVAFHLEVLPALAPGVLVGVHDVFLPDDYLPEWSQWRYSEQYLLATALLSGAGYVRPVLAAWHASGQPDLAAIVAPLLDELGLVGLGRRGCALWFETGPVSY
jgi:Methyltransferase domain